MNNQTIEKITYIEDQVQNIKTILKEQANQIGKYHKVLKEISSQLTRIKEKLTMQQNNTKDQPSNKVNNN